MATADDIPRSWTLSSLAALVAIAVGPPTLAVALGDASWIPLVAGAAIWGGSVCAKRFIVRAVRRVSGGWTLAPFAALEGLVSGLTELVPALAYLATLHSARLARRPRIWGGCRLSGGGHDVLVFGILTPRIDPDVLRAWIDGATVSWCVRYAVPIERLCALIGHVGSRGLLYIAVQRQDILGFFCAVAAVILFAAIDGVAIFGHARKWNWHDPVTCRRAYSYFAILGIAEFALFIVSSKQLD